jgi:hypothetical protein
MARSPDAVRSTETFPNTISPNHYELSGDGISISYLPTAGPAAPGGGGFFSYQDELTAVTFRGDQIRRAEVPDLGAVVSVTLHLTVDAGSTTFSVLLPAVNLPDQPGASAPVSTDGITTRHKLSLVAALGRGQREHYRVTPLAGTASNVIVPL